MPKEKTIYCNNRSVDRPLPDAKHGALLEPGGEGERSAFFGEHLDQCRACRDEIMDHANQLALSEVAEEKNIEIDQVVERLGETAKQLRDFARDWDIPFEEAVLRILRARQSVTTNSNPIRGVSLAAATEP